MIGSGKVYSLLGSGNAAQNTRSMSLFYKDGFSDMLEGVITKGIGGFYYVRTVERSYECKARGKLRREGLIPMVGDRVQISVEEGRGNIERILPRKTMLVRPAVANIDQLIVVAAMSSPQPNPALIDHFLLIGEMTGVHTVLCLNKIDLDTRRVEQLAAIYRKAGYQVLCTSTVQKEGVSELRALLQNRITAFAGNSGVGKSSILNMVGLNQLLLTGEVSEKLGRGRHTTRHVELIELVEGGFVLDTPGFSTFELPNIEAAQLQDYYPEFAPYLGNCRFRGCSHTGEPGCAILEAVQTGEIGVERHESYCDLYRELKQVKAW